MLGRRSFEVADQQVPDRASGDAVPVDQRRLLAAARRAAQCRPDRQHADCHQHIPGSVQPVLGAAVALLMPAPVRQHVVAGELIEIPARMQNDLRQDHHRLGQVPDTHAYSTPAFSAGSKTSRQIAERIVAYIDIGR
jgi:hypothetical protein